MEFMTLKNIQKDYIMLDLNLDCEKKINYYQKTK